MNDEFIIALAGNPNVGKSSIFNQLTGLNQHTGNWPGKTVSNARGSFSHQNKKFLVVDIPGIYSLFASSVDEKVSRDFLCFENPDLIVVVADATCLERNLFLLFQILELTNNVVLCINLIDEAAKKNIHIDIDCLKNHLNIPIVTTSATNNIGIEDLKNLIVYNCLNKRKNSTIVKYSDKIENYISIINKSFNDNTYSVNSRWLSLRILDCDEPFYNSILKTLDDNTKNLLTSNIDTLKDDISKDELRENINETIYKKCEYIKKSCIKETEQKNSLNEKIDNVLTSKKFGLPIMLFLLSIIFWITIKGANVPSQMLASLLFGFEDNLFKLLNYLGLSSFLTNLLVLGIYKTLAWVISVMLPPMAIFFPLFSLLEDLGYLPRVAFNMDHLFKKACCHGKQCLSMCMGFGCNAAGVIGCRIIDSPRERLLAIITNNFVPCNGRFPTLFAISGVFFVTSNAALNCIIPTIIVTSLIIMGVIATLFTSFALSKTILKGVPSTFTLELPPYRKPQLLKTLYTSLIDRTLFVLYRAIIVAIPAGAITYLLANIFINDITILNHIANFLNPLANCIGLDGFILMAFILGLPANEIVLPILLMAYLSSTTMIEFDSLDSLRKILIENNWTYLTAINTMIFSVLHWPCSTTLITIKKETKSYKWTFLSFIIPTIVAFIVCFFTTLLYKLLF